MASINGLGNKPTLGIGVTSPTLAPSVATSSPAPSIQSPNDAFEISSGSPVAPQADAPKVHTDEQAQQQLKAELQAANMGAPRAQDKALDTAKKIGKKVLAKSGKIGEALDSDVVKKIGGAGGRINKGLGAIGNASVLVRDDASVGEKIEAGARVGKVAAEVVQVGAEKIAKGAAKTVAKGAAKAIPILGTAADIADTVNVAQKAYDTFNDPKASTGDKVWAAAHTVTTAAGVIPIVGDAISFAGDVADIWLGK